MSSSVMGWLAWIIIGTGAGWIASRIVQTRLGLLMDIVVGILGAFLGGIMLNLIGVAGVTGFNFWSLVVAIIGAVVFLGVLRLLIGRGYIESHRS